MSTGELLPAISRLLEDTFQLSGWTITRTSEGQQKECYIARDDQRTVFLKLDGDTPVDVLRRLGELGVAPCVLRAGEIAGRSYVLQDYVTGSHPGWRWFADHLPLLAQVTHRYHSDRQLQHLLRATSPPAYHEHVSAELTLLESQLSAVLANVTAMRALGSTLRAVFTELQTQADQLSAVPMAPVHADPNGANIIMLIDDRMVLVDWDGMLLSDPLRDVSQWLGWYVSSERWPIFFAEYGLPVDESLLARVYWWSARASFANVLWHLERHYEHDVFLHDALAALHRDITPHQVFHEDH